MGRTAEQRVSSPPTAASHSSIRSSRSRSSSTAALGRWRPSAFGQQPRYDQYGRQRSPEPQYDQLTISRRGTTSSSRRPAVRLPGVSPSTATATAAGAPARSPRAVIPRRPVGPLRPTAVRAPGANSPTSTAPRRRNSPPEPPGRRRTDPDPERIRRLDPRSRRGRARLLRGRGRGSGRRRRLSAAAGAVTAGIGGGRGGASQDRAAVACLSWSAWSWAAAWRGVGYFGHQFSPRIVSARPRTTRATATASR